MINYTTIGFFSWFGSGILIIFHVISTLTGTGSEWQRVCLADIEYIAKIGAISLFGLDSVVGYIINIPLHALLFVIGLLAFIIDGCGRPG